MLVDGQQRSVIPLQILGSRTQHALLLNKGHPSKAVTRTGKHAPDRPRIIRFQDPQHTRIATKANKEGTNEYDDDVGHIQQDSANASLSGNAGSRVCSTHPEVGNPPEDETKKAVKE